MSIARLFHKLGVSAYHQKTDPPAAAMAPYNFKNPPSWATGHITRKAQTIKKQEKPYFESSWAMSHYIYLISLEFPEADFLILLRDPDKACNSLRSMSPSRHSRNIDELALLYNMTLLSILNQSIAMERRPRWIAFDKYIRGESTPALFSLFGIEPSATNQTVAESHLAEKINSSGSYDLKWSPYFKEGRQVVRHLKRALKEIS
jgi:hypothetical protein